MMEAIPLDQYCAQQSKEGLEDGNILTEDPNVILQAVSQKPKTLAREDDDEATKDEPVEKKMKEENMAKAETEEGELVDDEKSTVRSYKYSKVFMT